MIWKGSYTLEVKISMNQFLNSGKTLEKTVENYNQTCEMLTKKIPTTQCKLVLQDLQMIVTRGREMENFIKEFFPSRKTRGFLTWIGAMDSDDRIRVDKNVDVLRKNEETLKDTINHQTTTVDAMYKFIDNSMVQIENRMKQVTDNFNTIHMVMEENMNFSKAIKRIIYLEAELIEIGFHIQTSIENLKYQQNLILQILLGKEQGMTWVIQLIEPSYIFKLLEKAYSKLPGDVTFIRRKINGDLNLELLNLIDLSYETMNNEILNLKFKVPLVSKQKFTAFRGITLPQINGTLVAIIGLEKNILIQENDKDFGHVITENKFNECKILPFLRICNLESKETSLDSDENCLINMRFKNSTKNCKVKILNVTEDTWFATEDPNVWEYVAPSEIKANVFRGYNHSFMPIKGTGVIVLTPGMVFITNHTKLTYANVSIIENENIILKYEFNQMNFSLNSIDNKLIPKLKGNISKYSIYDHKKLFDLGVDIEELKLSRPQLENTIYSPLSSTWTLCSIITGAVIMLGSLVIIYKCLIKGNTSCKTEDDTKVQPHNKNSIKIEHIPIITIDKARMHKPYNTLPRPTLEIMMDSIESLPPPPNIKHEETYLEPMVNLTKSRNNSNQMKQTKRQQKCAPSRLY